MRFQRTAAFSQRYAFSLTPAGKIQQFLTNWKIIYFFLPSEKWLYLRRKKKHMNMTRGWIVLAPEGTADKKQEGIHRNSFVFLFFSNVFLAFVHLGWLFNGGGGGGTGDNSNSTAKFKIEFMNYPALWLFFFGKTKPLKQNMGEITVGWNLLNCFSELNRQHFYVAKNDCIPSRFNVLSC